MNAFPINFRPIGALHDHTITKYKNNLMLYRSADLTKHISLLPELANDLSIDCLVDLRAEDEKIAFPLDVLDGMRAEYYNFPLVDPDRSIRDSRNPDFNVYGQTYYHLLKGNIEKIITILNLLIYSSCQRFIFFCYAGKDRTGILSAIILFLLGTPMPLITTDYEMSSTYLISNIQFFEKNWLKRNMSLDTYKNRFKVDIRSLVLMFYTFKKNHGGLLPYLLSQGLKEKDLFILQEKFKQHKSVVLEPGYVSNDDFWSFT